MRPNVRPRPDGRSLEKSRCRVRAAASPCLPRGASSRRRPAQGCTCILASPAAGMQCECHARIDIHAGRRTGARAGAGGAALPGSGSAVAMTRAMSSRIPNSSINTLHFRHPLEAKLRVRA